MAPRTTLLVAAIDVIDSADHTGCSDDLTVVSRSAVHALQQAANQVPTMTCPICHGNGERVQDEIGVKCPTCKGQGEIPATDDYEYTFAHMENAMLLMEALTLKTDDCGPWRAELSGRAGLREHLCEVAREMDTQFAAIGIKWDEECDWEHLCQRIATAITLHPTETPAQLVRDVLNAELKIVFRPEGKCRSCGRVLTAGDKTLGNCGECKTPIS